MSPFSLCGSGTEDGHQRALFCWANMASRFGLDASFDEKCYNVKGYATDHYILSNELLDLVMLFAVPNGGLRDKITAANLKAGGVKSGVPDIFLDVACGEYHGLRIELKRPKSRDKREGVVSSEQSVWIAMLNARGYCAVTCFGWFEAVKTVLNYLGVKNELKGATFTD